MYHAVHTGLQVGRLRQDGVFVCAHLYLPLPLPHSKELSIHIQQYMCIFIVVESYSRSYRYTLFNAIPCVHLYYNILSTVLRSTVKYIRMKH